MDGQDGYTVRRSGPWPEDTVFCGVWSEGRIEVMWGGNRIAWYERQPDGEWYLSGLQDYSADTWYVDAWCGLYEDGTGRFIVGNTAVPLTDGCCPSSLIRTRASSRTRAWPSADC